MAGSLSSGLRKVAGNLAGTAVSGGTTRRSQVPAGGSVNNSGKNITKNLAYPIGVESDAGQGHYIIFEVMKQNKAKLSGQKIIKDVTKVARNVAAQVGVSSGNTIVGVDELGHLGGSKKQGNAKSYPANKGKKQSGPNSLQVAQNATTAMPTMQAMVQTKQRLKLIY